MGCTATNCKKVYCALVLPYLDYCSQECAKLAWMAKEWYGLPLLKDSLVNKFCSVVGLYFGWIQFFVLHLYVMQDCSSHVDRLSRLMGNFLYKIRTINLSMTCMLDSIFSLYSINKFGLVLVLTLRVVVDRTTWNSKLMGTEAKHGLHHKAWWIPLNCSLYLQLPFWLLSVPSSPFEIERDTFPSPTETTSNPMLSTYE